MRRRAGFLLAALAGILSRSAWATSAQEVILRRGVAEHRSHFTAQRSQILARHPRAVGAAGSATFGLREARSVNGTIAVVTAAGQRQLRLSVSRDRMGPRDGEALYAGIVAGGFKGDGEAPERRRIRAAGVGIAAELERTPHRGRAFYLGLGVGVVDGRELRQAAVSIPLSPPWRTGQLRRADKALELVNRAAQHIDDGRLNDAQHLLWRLGDMRRSEADWRDERRWPLR
jgi:hypothetical protein